MCLQKVIGIILVLGGLGVVTKSAVIGIILILIGLMLLFGDSDGK